VIDSPFAKSVRRPERKIPHHVLAKEIFAIDFVVNVFEVSYFIEIVFEFIGDFGHVFVVVPDGRRRGGDASRVCGITTTAFTCW
jgi:hypothetical protein